MGKKGTFSLISAVTVGSCGEIVVADSRVQLFSAKGDFLEILYDEGKGTLLYENKRKLCLFVFCFS